nr:hypothetical protein [Paenibacillus larvae]
MAAAYHISYCLGHPRFFGIEIIGVSKLEMGTGMVLFPAWISWLSTMAWVFGITNMVNFIDGLDGLASAIVTISSLTLLITAFLMQQTEPAVLAGSLAGACLAFLFLTFTLPAFLWGMQEPSILVIHWPLSQLTGHLRVQRSFLFSFLF